MATINPYLNFEGNTEEAFSFYKSVFGGEFTTLMRYKDIPESEIREGFNIEEDEKEKIMHIALPIGNGNILMATDVVKAMSQNFTVGDNISLSLSTESREEADRLFEALSENGSHIMPLADAFWGDYFGMCVDKFGIRWMLSYQGDSK